MTVLTKNLKGYQNLCQLVTRGFQEGFYYKPRVDFELLEKYSEGIDKKTYVIIPSNHPIYPFPYNLEDRVEFLKSKIYKNP